MDKDFFKKYKIVFYILLVIAVFSASYFIYSNTLEAPDNDIVDETDIDNGDENGNRNGEAESPDEEVIELPSSSEGLIVAVGDIMVHTPQLSQARDPATGGYDFAPSFEFIADYLREGDITVGNFESTFAGRDRGYDGYPLFNSPDELALNLKEAGFDILCTANNHSLDRGEQGLYRTLDILEETGIPAFGTARSQEERDAVLVQELNEDINVAFLAYTDSTNGIPVPAGRDYMINYINLDRDPSLTEAESVFRRDIGRARQAGADLVAVYMHWGYEYHFTPSRWQEELALILAKSGADIILGSHPHVIQPMDYITVEKENGEEHSAFVIYSMGNFISNQHYIPGAIPTEEVKYGILVYIYVEKDLLSGETELTDVKYMLTWVNRDWRHRILPLYKVLENTPELYHIQQHKYNRLQPVRETIGERLSGFQPVY